MCLLAPLSGRASIAVALYPISLAQNIWLKFENLHFTATFKERGALNRLSALSVDERRRGVIAASAGNQAQGVAYHAARLSVPATIFVPLGTPTVKIENTRRHGANLIEGGATLEEAAALAIEHGRKEHLTFIHPDDVIAGQGTIALEMLAAVPDLDILIIPLGGFGGGGPLTPPRYSALLRPLF